MRSYSSLRNSDIYAIAFAVLLSPVIQHAQEHVIGAAGRAAWISTALSAVPLILLVLLMERLLKNRADNEGLAEMLSRSAGALTGRLLALVYAAWGAVLIGVTLRSGAERFLGVLFPQSGPLMFLITMTALVLVSTLGRPESIGRFARITLPLFLIVFLAVFIFGITGIKAQNLLPVGKSGVPAIFNGALPVTGIAAVALLLFFFKTGAEPEPQASRGHSRILIPAALLLVAALELEVIGSYGAELTQRLHNPFFLITRDITLFGALSRVESPIIALWAVTDFILCAAFAMISRDNLKLSFGLKRTAPAAACVCAAAFALSLLPEDVFALEAFASRTLPQISAVMAALPFLVLAIGKLRKKI